MPPPPNSPFEQRAICLSSSYMEDNLLRAGKTIAEALAINKAAYGANGLPLVATYVEQSVLQLYQGDARAAERTAKRGLAILKRLGLERYDANTTRLLDALGRALETRGRLASDKKAARIFFTVAVKTMWKMVFARCRATTRRVEKLPPSRVSSTS